MTFIYKKNSFPIFWIALAGFGFKVWKNLLVRAKKNIFWKTSVRVAKFYADFKTDEKLQCFTSETFKGTVAWIGFLDQSNLFKLENKDLYVFRFWSKISRDMVILILFRSLAPLFLKLAKKFNLKLILPKPE
jgi:hypothetical protein